MKIFITGGTGFIGAAVAKALVERKHEVIALIRSGSLRPGSTPPGVETVVGDMMAPDTFQEAARAAEVIIHAAQLRFPSRVSEGYVREAEAADESAVMNLVRAAHESKFFKLFIYTSGCWVYGDRDAQLLNEQSGFRPTRLAEGHHRTGQALLKKHRDEGFPAVVLSPGMVYGPGGPFLGMIQALEKGRLRKIGGGKNFWSPVHIEDVAAAYALAAERAKPGGFYNVVDDNPVLVRDFLDFMCRCFNRLPLGGVPKFLAGLFMGRLLVDSLNASFRVSNQKIRNELGWRPRYPSFREGLPPVLNELGRRTPPGASTSST